MKTIHNKITRSDERFHTKLDWLDSWHSFSFGHHFDPERIQFGPLRVVNDDIVSPGGGFPTHPHQDMEIITLVLRGQLEHKDSMGNGRVIEPGDIQYMSAGTGVYHSEFNPSNVEDVRLLQIWIQPHTQGLEPTYADRKILGKQDNEWSLLLSNDGRDGSMAIRQDAHLSSVRLTQGKSIAYSDASSDRGYWLFVINGEVEVAGSRLSNGDSVELSGLQSLEIRNSGQENAEVILFDLPVS